MTDPTSYDSHTNANQHAPETVPADDVYRSSVQPSASEAAQGRTTSAVVARGTLVLSLLSRQAAAARAEAQCAELRILLGEAQAGESSRLQRWLRIHAAEYTGAEYEYPAVEYPAVEYPTDCSPGYLPADAWPLSEGPLRCDSASSMGSGPRLRDNADGSVDELLRAAVPTGGRLPGGLNDWQSLLAPARARLHEQAERLRTGSVQARDRQVEEEKWAGERVGGTDGGASSHIEKKQVIKEQQLQHQQRMRAWRGRGALLSMLAHGVLLLLLAWMTLRPPQPPASLALQANPVEWLPQALEVSQPMELSSPEQPAEDSATQEAFDVSQSLSQVSSDVGSTLTELAAPLASGLPSQSLLSAHSGALKLIQSSTTFFGAAASGNCFCYVIDGSGSMRNGPWEAARFELLKSLASLTEKQRFYIIFFNRELSAIPLPGEKDPAPAALYATRENLAHTRRWLDTLRIGIGAPPNDALAMAIDKEPDAIYLLTDGVTSVDVAGFLRERNRISDFIAGEQVRVPVHTIAFYSLDGQAMLKQLAAENAGHFIYVPDPRR